MQLVAIGRNNGEETIELAHQVSHQYAIGDRKIRADGTPGNINFTGRAHFNMVDQVFGAAP